MPGYDVNEQAGNGIGFALLRKAREVNAERVERLLRAGFRDGCSARQRHYHSPFLAATSEDELL
jgi:hypothetical protein